MTETRIETDDESGTGAEAGAPMRLLVGGEWVPARDGATFAVHDPGTGDLLHDVADASAADGLAALGAATGAFRTWRHSAPAQRAEILERVAAGIEARAEAFARLMTLEMGRTLAESRDEVSYAASFASWFAGEALRPRSEHRRLPQGDVIAMIVREAVGPCLLITPWNFPLSLPVRKLAPALAAGCTVVLKPSPETPATALLLGEVLQEAGVPPGVVNILPTSDAPGLVTVLLDDGRVRKLSFTGSTAVGRQLAQQAGRRLVRCSLELGGDAPFIVFDDTDVETAVEGLMIAKFRNGGAACTAANRIYVQSGVYDEVLAAFATRVEAMTVGHGLSPDVDLGAMVTAHERDRLTDLVAQAEGDGAHQATEKPVPSSGNYVAPTVLTGLAHGSVLHGQELFGPVAPVAAFDETAQVIDVANDTPYGLVAYVYTTDLERAHRVPSALDFGMVALNRGTVSNAAAPFGGVKASGYGREGGHEGIDEYLSVKYVSMDAAP